MQKKSTYQLRVTQMRIYALLLLATFVFQSCSKLIEVTPPNTSINSGNVYANDATAIAAVTNIYVTMSRANLSGGGITSINLFPALSSDELSLYNGATNNAVNYYYQNALSQINLNNPDFWTVLYQTIYDANAAIEGLANVTTLKPVIKQQLTGEAKFVRAFCYFYLVNLYGNVPLALASDYSINALLPRISQVEVYNQIISDLKDAQALLSENYLNATLLTTTVERVRPTKWAATALLARAYLFNREYSKAEIEASRVINNAAFSLPSDLNSVFLKNSSEAIWQLQPVNAGWNTEDAKTFILLSNGPNAFNYPFYLSSQLLNSFETNDHRKTKWIKSVTAAGNTYYYAYKYKSSSYNDPVTEYQMVLRLSEQYLIRAESRAHQNKIGEAKDDLNVIRVKAGLGYTSANDQISLYAAILQERKVEFFTEWGHRWFDLKRTGNVDAVMSSVTHLKGGTWNTNGQWYPISKYELQVNPNLIQNSGY